MDDDEDYDEVMSQHSIAFKALKRPPYDYTSPGEFDISTIFKC